MKFKKQLGQHFLINEEISKQIVESLPKNHNYDLLEIGPGGGAITKYLKDLPFNNYKMVEIDEEKVNYLINELKISTRDIILQDVLQMALPFDSSFHIIGNFPYNISSQIMFKVLDWKENVESVIGMFQKEVAIRICSKEGNKDYGILSVLLQAFFKTIYLFDVPPNAFNPPPKVFSGVIKLENNNNKFEIKEFNKFQKFVKTAFSMRRKTLRNNFKPLLQPEILVHEIFDKRAEQLSVESFVELYKQHYGQ